MKFLILLLFIMNFATAQKVVKKSIVHNEIFSFQIDTNNCFKADIMTGDTDEVLIEATIDGEYKKDLVLNVKEEGTTVLVGASFQPNFENPNDKLSAHKVVSIALKISIPKQKDVRVFGTSSNVKVTGIYKKLKITLNDGDSNLNDVKGRAIINAQSGDIVVESESAEIHSTSKYGKVGDNQIPTGDNKYQLNTVTGDISFKRIE